MGAHVAEPFHVTNVVNQGGILSPALLFCIWMTLVCICQIWGLGGGGTLTGNVLNYFGYADDLYVCLLSLTSAGMQ